MPKVDNLLSAITQDLIFAVLLVFICYMSSINFEGI